MNRADQLMSESRERIRNLRSQTGAVAALPEALSAVGEERRAEESIGFRLVVEGAPRELNAVIRDEMYLIGREAIVNSLTHSLGSTVEVEINFDQAGVRLRVRDDGKGIPSEILRSGGVAGHWGLSGMQERAHKIGGQFKIWNRSGAGTEVELKVPGGIAYPREDEDFACGPGFAPSLDEASPILRWASDRAKPAASPPRRTCTDTTPKCCGNGLPMGLLPMPHRSLSYDLQRGAAIMEATEAQEYDLVVLGSGEGGKYLAWTLAKQGKRVAVVERKYIGGSCPNIACLPSKNIIHSAKVASYFFRSTEFGISKDNVQIDMAAVRDRKRKMVDGLVQIHLDNYKASGAELILGSGRFVGPKTLEVALNNGETRVVRAKKIVIGTGTHATLPEIPGLAEAKPLTHIEALELDHIPEHLLVMGGGYVGLELAQAMRRFGSRVTVIDRNERLAHKEDEDVSQALHELFRDEGIDVVTSGHVGRVDGQSGQSVKLHILQDGTERVLEGTHLLVATGRTPNTAGIGLELAGVELTDRGYIKVDERLRTTAPDVWAIGDCAGSPHFTHISFDDFRVIRDDLAGGHRVTTGRQVPFCMFTDPELAQIGLQRIRGQGKRDRLPAGQNSDGRCPARSHAL